MERNTLISCRKGRPPKVESREMLATWEKRKRSSENSTFVTGSRSPKSDTCLGKMKPMKANSVRGSLSKSCLARDTSSGSSTVFTVRATVRTGSYVVCTPPPAFFRSLPLIAICMKRIFDNRRVHGYLLCLGHRSSALNGVSVKPGQDRLPRPVGPWFNIYSTLRSPVPPASTGARR